MSNSLFNDHFKAAPQATASAHGRANLIGDHTDYNHGYVLPCLLTHQTSVSVSLRADDKICGISEEFGPAERQTSSPVDGSWLDFIIGAINLLKPHGWTAPGIDIAITSTVPAGAGVSSSAAFEIALLRAMIICHELNPLTDRDLALCAQKIEHDYIGTQCGIMDQMVVASADFGQAMMLDCQNLETELGDLFDDYSFVVIHSGSGRKLSEGLYNQRLSECQQASTILGVTSLRQVNPDNIDVIKGQELHCRARHVVTENQRVLDAFRALKAQNAQHFGELMTESHHSLAEDYDVSSPELDQLVKTCLNQGALGARLTGAGFGGCVVALFTNDMAHKAMAKIKPDCPNAYLVDVIKR